MQHLTMKSGDFAVVIPAKDESESIESVIREIKAVCANGVTVLVVNDASEDQTERLAQSAGAEVLQLTEGLGAWRAAQTGLRYLSSHGYDLIVTFDADGQHLADSIPRMLEHYAVSGPNILIGASIGRGSRSRHLSWKILRAVSGLPVTDLTSGLRLYDKKALDLLSGVSATYLKYQDVGVLALAAKNKMTIEELEVKMAPRMYGGSKIFGSWFAVARYLLHALFLALAKREFKSFKTKSYGGGS